MPQIASPPGGLARPRRLTVAALGFVLVTIGAIAVVMFQGDAGTAVAASDQSPRATPPLARQDFVRRVRLTGLTEATRSFVVTTPRLEGQGGGSLVVTQLAGPGTPVKAGDVVVTFDPQSQIKTALEKRAEYRDLVEQITRKQAEQEAARVKDDSELQQARHAVSHDELEVLKNEWVPRYQAEQNEQKLDESRQRVTALAAELPLKRAAAAADLRILEIKRDRARIAMEHAQANAEAMTVRSPIDGLVVPKMHWKGGGLDDVREGDELWPGSPVVEVVNQASMRVRAKVNQADLPSIRIGQPVVVHLDAYPDFEMPGRIAELSPIGLPGSFSDRVRSFTAMIAVEGSSPQLLPDLTAAIDVEVERVHQALVVPREAVDASGSTPRVRIRSGSGSAWRDVTLGPSDEVAVVVTSGLEAGQVVLR
jgi:HlyD family secretion protein